LTVVSVCIPLDSEGIRYRYCRAWLDLNRGALPMKMFCETVISGHNTSPLRNFDRVRPTDVVRTHDVAQLQNGAYYPTKTTLEHIELDPDARELSGEEILDIADGKRKLPLAVFYRESWSCTQVEIKTDYPADFFVLPIAQSSETDVY
jgi:hypothetical protein